MAKTADRLLEGIKRRAIAPASQPLLEDEDYLALADDVIEELIAPLLLSVKQDFFVTTEDEDIVADQAVYSIPYRSIGRGLRDLKLTDGSTTRDMPLIASEDAHIYTTGTPQGFYFRGDKIVVVPTPDSATLTLQKWYNLAPSRLVKLDQAAVVTGSTATTVTVSSIPSVITTSTVVDFIDGRSGNSIRAMDVTVQNAAGTTLTFTSGDIPTDIASGDYVSVYQTTPVLPLPNEAYPLLETATAKRVLRALGDFEGASALEQDESEEAKRLKMILEPRVEGENTIILNRKSLLRGSRARFRKGLLY